MSTRIKTLWLVDERPAGAAYLYCHVPPARREGREPNCDELVFVPKSIVEHRSKRGVEHDVKLPEWFLSKKKL